MCKPWFDKRADIIGSALAEDESGSGGIPNFWLTAMEVEYHPPPSSTTLSPTALTHTSQKTSHPKPYSQSSRPMTLNLDRSCAA